LPHLVVDLLQRAGGGEQVFLVVERIEDCQLCGRLRRVYADSVVFTDDTLAMAVRTFGSDNVLYGSDYPHTIGDPIGCMARVDRLPERVRERVRGRNAERIFGFG
jgi:aminocarboxymuconate-semialdehyde decarboxylase